MRMLDTDTTDKGVTLSQQYNRHSRYMTGQFSVSCHMMYWCHVSKSSSTSLYIKKLSLWMIAIQRPILAPYLLSAVLSISRNYIVSLSWGNSCFWLVVSGNVRESRNPHQRIFLPRQQILGCSLRSKGKRSWVACAPLHLNLIRNAWPPLFSCQVEAHQSMWNVRVLRMMYV